ALPASRARPPAARAAGGLAGVPLRRPAFDTLAQWAARHRGRARDPGCALSLAAGLAGAARAAGSPRRVPLRGGLGAAPLLRGARALAAADKRALGERPLCRLRLRPADPALSSAVRARAEHLLGLLRVRHRQVELGAAFLLRRAARRDRPRRGVGVLRLPALPVRAAARSAR